MDFTSYMSGRNCDNCLNVLPNYCDNCRNVSPNYDDHAFYVHCRLKLGHCQLVPSDPCLICKDWPNERWNKLRRGLIQARRKFQLRGSDGYHWSDGYQHV